MTYCKVKAWGEKLNRYRLCVCLGDDEIETYLLQQEKHDPVGDEWVSQHIHECYECYSRYFDLRNYHTILSAELAKPISRQIVQLVKGIQTN